MFLSWQITGNWMWQALVFSHGGTMLTADEKKVAFDGPAGQKAIGVLGRLVNEANMPNSTFAAEAPNFIAGGSACCRTLPRRSAASIAKSATPSP